ncbi:MAG TPA: replication-relaxation family protein [Bdellovibrionales bacterium]|nr:replication-relaxation family protein [Bdellovibrionales bacterium]
MILTNRDRELLSLLARMGLLTTRQLNRVVFKNIAITTVLRRLRVLEGSGYISRVEGLKNNENGWCLTLKGADAIGFLFPKRRFNRSTLDHDVMLADLRLILEDQGIAHSWIPEHEIRSKMARSHGIRRMESQTVPDGIMGVEYEGLKHSVAIELELNYKNKDRYKKIFWSYRGKDRNLAVWYFVPSKKFGESLSSLWAKHVGTNSRVWLLWSEVDDVLKNGSQARIHYFDHTNQIVDLFKPKPAHEAALGVSRLSDEKSEIEKEVSIENEKELPAKVS